jgi:hypothetical protein
LASLLMLGESRLHERTWPDHTEARTNLAEHSDHVANELVVSEMLCHASVTITYDTYSHVIPGMAEDATSKVAALLFPAHS